MERNYESSKVNWILYEATLVKVYIHTMGRNTMVIWDVYLCL